MYPRHDSSSLDLKQFSEGAETSYFLGERVPPVDGSVPEMISPLSHLHSFFFQSPAMSPGHSDFIQ